MQSMMAKQGIDGSAAKPALRLASKIMVKKTYYYSAIW